ncbi:histidinol dehydrogenase [Sporolactobacillus shoreicorticis]|uniref:Histidinol dehydrogenase n=1 Tax=Sporolactobacillus shoreicorticis TaxID=1923877 RepID=A0ABW5S306_9BACL|nr:histidinol dehydrogenase [Sporolactobacillus shoreicorticis]MCO7125291.1 histidinol dehydrogenase [Sporolactobacillus shoreicorticis]
MEWIKKAVEKTYERDRQLTELVSGIINNVRLNGDQELIKLAGQFDHVTLESVKVSKSTVKEAYEKIDGKTIDALKFAAENISFYAESQYQCLKALEISSPIPGVTLGHRLIPVDRCGAYIPGGRYPLPSSALMSIITAKIAGVKSVAACCPPATNYGTIHPAVLVAMDIAGADEIYAVGGAQAIAALAYGTETVPKVNLIVGPGNRFVTEAKRQVLGDVGIDSLAGPSEVLILADETSNPNFVAIDLLAQAEHDPNTKTILICTDRKMIEAVQQSLEKYSKELSTNKIADQSWKDNGQIILADHLEEAIEIANRIAPEHLEVQTKNPKAVSTRLNHFGSLFIGEHAPVAFGDYVSGTNHILPTMGTAKYSNGVWVGTFIKTSFYQEITEEGCQNLSEACMQLAQVEGLHAHRESVSVRVNAFNEK